MENNREYLLPVSKTALYNAPMLRKPSYIVNRIKHSINLYGHFQGKYFTIRKVYGETRYKRAWRGVVKRQQYERNEATYIRMTYGCNELANRYI